MGSQVKEAHPSHQSLESIRRDQVVPDGYKQSEAGVIPEDWVLGLLDAVSKRGSGHTPDKAHPDYWGGDVKWISLQDSGQLDQLYIDETAATITKAGIANSSAVIHPAGTVVLSRDAGVGKSAIMQSDMAVSQHFIAWTCGSSLSNIFLYYWLQFKKSEFERVAMGSTIKTIGLPYFKRLSIPLPRLAEQTAIANALSDVDALISSLENLIAKKQAIKTAAMQQLLTGRTRLPQFARRPDGIVKGTKQTELGEVPEDWDTVSLGKLGHFFKGSGISRDQANSGSIPCIRYGEIYTRHHDVVSEFYSFISDAVALSAFRLNPGDLLFSGSGETKAEIGKTVAFVDNALAYAGGDIVILRPISGCSLFLGYLLNQPIIAHQKTSRGQGDAVVHISATALSSILVTIPTSEAEKMAIAGVFSDMDTEIQCLRRRLVKTHQLKQGMMQELLTGRTRFV